MPETEAMPDCRLYDDGADALMASDLSPDRISLLPGRSGKIEAGRRIRILWGEDMLRDIVDGRYRAVICGVNDEDNSHGIVAQIVNLVTASQWSERTVTSYAKVFHESVDLHAAEDREPYVLKYDLDSILVFALLRPRGRDHFTLQDISRGFTTITRMLQGRRDRLPVASVSFLGARSNRLVGADGQEPSFETLLQTVYDAGFRGDMYPSPRLWQFGHVGVFPNFPFPEGLGRMREGSS